MIKSINAFTIDCANPRKLAQFWADAFNTQITGDYDYYVTISTPEGAPPAIGFQRVPEAKTTKNRVHLDIGTDDREAEVARLIEMGASRLDDQEIAGVGMSWTVMADPEGNEFCVSDNHAL